MDNPVKIIAFIQNAIEQARGGAHPSGKYTPERLKECAFIKEVAGGYILGEDESMVIIKMSTVSN